MERNKAVRRGSTIAIAFSYNYLVDLVQWSCTSNAQERLTNILNTEFMNGASNLECTAGLESSPTHLEPPWERRSGRFRSSGWLTVWLCELSLCYCSRRSDWGRKLWGSMSLRGELESDTTTAANPDTPATRSRSSGGRQDGGWGRSWTARLFCSRAAWRSSPCHWYWDIRSAGVPLGYVCVARCVVPSRVTALSRVRRSEGWRIRALLGCAYCWGCVQWCWRYYWWQEMWRETPAPQGKEVFMTQFWGKMANWFRGNNLS